MAAGWTLNGNQLTTSDSVGIGTTNPAHPLHLGLGKALRIEGGTSATDAADYFSFGGNGNFGIDAPGVPDGRFVVHNNGNVGIAMATPAHPLHLGPGKALRIEGGTSATDAADYFSFGGNGNFGIDAPGVPDGRFVVHNNGNVGIGTPTPGMKLSIVDGGSTMWFQSLFGTPVLYIGTSSPAGSPGLILGNKQSEWNLRIDPTSGFKLYETQTSGSYMAVDTGGNLTVTGDVLLTGADCAEEFDAFGSEVLEPGTVVVLDECGALRESRNGYDKKVAGVISGAGEYKHALVLDRRQSDNPRIPLALVGKVYCKVDAQYSEIEVGDLLTTAPSPGHAMKAVDPLKSIGAVIGKALKPLKEGQSLIPILVALQ